MLVLRCTRKLLRRLHQKPARAVPESSTTLGDWYADLIHLGRKPVVLAVSARTLLPVLVPAREPQSLPARLAEQVGRTLEALRIRPELIAEERSRMQDVVFAPTASRQLLGSMNDFSRMLDVAHQGSLLESAVELGQAPCSPIGMVTPARATVKLFGSDFGDDWKHEIAVEKSLGPVEVSAQCIACECAGPPEDCGGAIGFERLRLVPEPFDLQAINRQLRGAGTSAFRRQREAHYEGG